MKEKFWAAVFLIILIVTLGLPAPEETPAGSPGEPIVKATCTACHRLEGEPTGRRFKKAPDLIGAGDKYQRAWLLAWLKNPKFKLYPMGYDFQEDRKQQHLALSAADAQAVAGKRYQSDWLYRFNQHPLDLSDSAGAAA